MKQLLTIILLGAVVVVVIWLFNPFGSTPAKAYREYRKAEAESGLNSSSLTVSDSALTRWKLKIDEVNIDGDTATVIATEKATYQVEQEAATVTNKVTTQYEGHLTKEDGVWFCEYEQVLEEKIE